MSAWTVIEHYEVGSGGAASIVLDNIPATYTDLVLVGSLRNSADIAGGLIAFNTGGSYSRRRLLGTGSASSSDTDAVDYQINASSFTASTFASVLIYIPNYTSSAAKSYSIDSVTENNATLSYQAIHAGSWTGTSAITDITLTTFAGTGNFTQYSSATLYGITKGSSGGVTVS